MAMSDVTRIEGRLADDPHQRENQLTVIAMLYGTYLASPRPGEKLVAALMRFGWSQEESETALNEVLEKVCNGDTTF